MNPDKEKIFNGTVYSNNLIMISNQDFVELLKIVKPSFVIKQKQMLNRVRYYIIYQGIIIGTESS